MGIFDSVMVPCPSCGTKIEFQSKSSEDKYCRTFELEEAPIDVLLGVNKNSPHSCYKCDTIFDVDLKIDYSATPRFHKNTTRTFHLRLDIAGFLYNNKDKPLNWFDKQATKPNGEYSTGAEYVAFLQNSLEEGHKFAQMCKCKNFDPITGDCSNE